MDSTPENYKSSLRNNIRIIGIPEDQEVKFDEESIIKKKFFQIRNTGTQIKEAQRVLLKIDSNIKTPRHYVFKIAKSKD